MDRPQLAILHDIPGRLRVRLPTGARTEGVSDAVSRLPGVAACRWSPRTRSLLTLYRPDEVVVDDLVESIATHADTDLAPVVRTHPTNGSGRAPSVVAGAVIETFASLNRRVARATGGSLTLGLLVPVALTLWAIRDATRGPMRALPWSTALWYAHGLFRDYNLTPGPD
ncbi:MAG TPA: hypothetical protein VIE37_06470 [Methylomirabilota bacterium]|jgi:hypothetical protein